jgi:hypothetical protein
VLTLCGDAAQDRSGEAVVISDGGAGR